MTINRSTWYTASGKNECYENNGGFPGGSDSEELDGWSKRFLEGGGIWAEKPVCDWFVVPSGMTY